MIYIVFFKWVLDDIHFHKDFLCKINNKDIFHSFFNIYILVLTHKYKHNQIVISILFLTNSKNKVLFYWFYKIRNCNSVCIVLVKSYYCPGPISKNKCYKNCIEDKDCLGKNKCCMSETGQYCCHFPVYKSTDFRQMYYRPKDNIW